MTLRWLIYVRPLPFAVLFGLPLGLAIAVLSSVPLTLLSDVAGVILALLALYGYPFWVVYSAPLPLVPNARRTAVVGAVIIAATVTLVFNPSTRSLPDTLPPLWSGFLGLFVGVAIFLPLGAAAYVLRNAELLRGRDIQLGGVSAFLWFFYTIFGWYALHRRVRIAAGVEAWTPGRGESTARRQHIEHTSDH